MGGAANAKALTARRKRLKELYALLYKHELDTDHRTHIYQNHFQDGDGAFQYLITVRATMLIKRAVLMLLLQPYLIGTTNMIADLFTKALDKGQFYKLRDVMMNHHAPLRDALSVAMCQMHGSASRLAQRLSRQL